MIGADYLVDNILEKYTGVKVPQFSFNRLANADNRLGVEMLSLERYVSGTIIKRHI